MAWLIIACFALLVLLFVIGAPLAIAFGLPSLILALTAMGLPLDAIAGFAFNSINSFPLLACPFFILCGTLLLRSGGMVYVRDFMESWFGQFRGGIAVAAVVVAAFVGAISGSTTASLALLATILLPIMVNAGYSRPFSSALLLTSAETDWLVPPSLGLILFGAMNRVSIADLFLAGMGTGLLTCFLIALTALIISRRRNYPAAPKVSWKARGNSFVKSLPLLMMPVVVLGGIYGGVFTPTESAVIACFYTLIIGLFVYRELNWSGIKEALLETAKLTTMIYMLIICADLFSKMISFLEVPRLIGDLVTGLKLGPLAFLLVMELVLLVTGFFFSSIPMILVVLPLFMPTVMELGIDPVFYGILAMMCACISEIHPPMGPQLWFAAPFCKEKIGNIVRESWIFLGIWWLALLVCTFVPDIAMFLVRLWR